ncbi:MAG TPA: ribbon-helix-helix protein, CopG family [Solirubrobacterales bacterium]|nr:ribbon-helix-helix protein, CopG family [Solirubrobacterales bacterium]
MAQVKDQPKERKRQRIFLKSGVEVTPELEEELAAEAERGYDLSRAKRRFLARPLLADGESHPKLTVPVSVEELNAVRQRAEDEGRTISEITREALKRYIDS